MHPPENQQHRKISLPELSEYAAKWNKFSYFHHLPLNNSYTSMPSLNTTAHYYNLIGYCHQLVVDEQEKQCSLISHKTNDELDHLTKHRKRKISINSVMTFSDEEDLICSCPLQLMQQKPQQRTKLNKIAKFSSMSVFPSVIAISKTTSPSTISNACDPMSAATTNSQCDKDSSTDNLSAIPNDDPHRLGAATIKTDFFAFIPSSTTTRRNLTTSAYSGGNSSTVSNFFPNLTSSAMPVNNNSSYSLQFSPSFFLPNSVASGITVLSQHGSYNAAASVGGANGGSSTVSSGSGSPVSKMTRNGEQDVTSIMSRSSQQTMVAAAIDNNISCRSSNSNSANCNNNSSWNAIPMSQQSKDGSFTLDNEGRHRIKLIDNSQRSTTGGGNKRNENDQPFQQHSKNEESVENFFENANVGVNRFSPFYSFENDIKRHPFYFAPVWRSNPGQRVPIVTTDFNSSPIIHNQFHYLTMAEKERFERLFREIDVDGNGLLDFNDLLHVLEKRGIKPTDDNVQHLIDRSDLNLDGGIDFAEFVSYCLENEKQLHVIFKNIDLNADGKIDASELVYAFKQVGLQMSEAEALHLVRKIKRYDTKHQSIEQIELDFEEFRDYLLLHPTNTFDDLLQSWRHGTFINFGMEGSLPVEFTEKELKSGFWWRHLIAGGIAGAVSRTATAPLDRLKIFLQVRSAEFSGLGICLKHMLQEGGVLSLWRGNGINVLKIAPETAIKFMAFDQIKRIIHNSPTGEVSIGERFVSGSLAGAISQTVIYPMEVLKTRFCLRETGQYKGLVDAASKIHSNGGIRNFYRGYVPNLIGIIPYAGIDLTIYETLKKMYLKKHSLEEAPIFVCLACGTLSSTFGQIASYPLALIRTRMQSETGTHRSSMVGMFRSILHREGCRGMYRGITANIMKVAPAVSISYVVYEYARRPLGAVMS